MYGMATNQAKGTPNSTLSDQRRRSLLHSANIARDGYCYLASPSLPLLPLPLHTASRPRDRVQAVSTTTHYHVKGATKEF